LEIVKSVKEMKELILEQKALGKTIGFVPTMGYLHEGHISLVKQAVMSNDIVVMSIYVNPTQFGANEDLDKYPRDFEGDCKLAEKEGVDFVFFPANEEMYPNGYNTYINVEGITEVLCGAVRPGHFRGVCTVVAKLFNIVMPDVAYFGQKDAQQVIVIKRMVSDLNINVKVEVCPIVREADGLAMSSRNSYLKPDERSAAIVLYRALSGVKRLIETGESDAGRLKEHIYEIIRKEKLASIEYAEIRNAEDLSDTQNIKGNVLIALAVKIGKTRLIDNIIINNI